MARREQSREDLLAEATALVECIELALPHWTEHVVIGFRRDGAASVYFGEDPAYHFNTHAELRRAYLAGRLIKAEQGYLVAMHRQRTAAAVELISQRCEPAEVARIGAECLQRLQDLSRQLSAQQFTVVGQVPPQVDVLGQVQSWLSTVTARFVIAQSPRVT